ncbi:hypothetical protein [Nocardia asteroides]|nr:hypothetical protein [Nocardia asteroides]UGT56960.1 hypothetical protein LTT85_08975 [Nocardia asteroides]
MSSAAIPIAGCAWARAVLIAGRCWACGSGVGLTVGRSSTGRGREIWAR